MLKYWVGAGLFCVLAFLAVALFSATNGGGDEAEVASSSWCWTGYCAILDENDYAPYGRHLNYVTSDSRGNVRVTQGVYTPYWRVTSVSNPYLR